jgi:hypothetical protein
MPLLIGAFMKVISFNKQRHTKYIQSAIPSASKCKNKLLFTIHTLIYWENWLCCHCYGMWECWRRRYTWKIINHFIKSQANLETSASDPVSVCNVTFLRFSLICNWNKTTDVRIHTDDTESRFQTSIHRTLNTK